MDPLQGGTLNETMSFADAISASLDRLQELCPTASRDDLKTRLSTYVLARACDAVEANELRGNGWLPRWRWVDGRKVLYSITEGWESLRKLFEANRRWAYLSIGLYVALTEADARDVAAPNN